MNFILQPLSSRKQPRNPLYRRLFGPQNRSVRSGEEENTRTPDRPDRILVPIQTTLSRLLNEMRIDVCVVYVHKY
jgi:hypothetical protein